MPSITEIAALIKNTARSVTNTTETDATIRWCLVEGDALGGRIDEASTMEMVSYFLRGGGVPLTNPRLFRDRPVFAIAKARAAATPETRVLRCPITNQDVNLSPYVEAIEGISAREDGAEILAVLGYYVGKLGRSIGADDLTIEGRLFAIQTGGLDTVEMRPLVRAWTRASEPDKAAAREAVTIRIGASAVVAEAPPADKGSGGNPALTQLVELLIATAGDHDIQGILWSSSVLSRLRKRVPGDAVPLVTRVQVLVDEACKAHALPDIIAWLRKHRVRWLAEIAVVERALETEKLL